MARTSLPITVTLGDTHEGVEARVQSERALDREDAALDDWMKRRVDEAFADSRPNVPARGVFKRLRHAHSGSSM